MKSIAMYLRALLVVLVLFVGNLLGEYLFWYDTIPQYDIYMHLLGGFAICMILVAIMNSYDAGMFYTRRGMNALIIGVLLAGLAWEIYEAVSGTSGNPLWSSAYFIDTIKDFVMDVAGGLMGIAVQRRMVKALRARIA